MGKFQCIVFLQLLYNLLLESGTFPDGFSTLNVIPTAEAARNSKFEPYRLTREMKRKLRKDKYWYAPNYGLQHFVIMGASSGGLPLKEKLLPEYLKDRGYSTHLVGKWHLGHSIKEFTPTYRGFDTHYGYWLGKQDYYTHISIDGRDDEGNGCWGFDFRNNTELNRSVFGKYDTDLFTDEAVRIIQNHDSKKPLFLMITHIAPHSANDYDPLQAPKENVNKFESTIKDENRRIYAGVMDKLDESVGMVVDALSKNGLLSNSIIVISSDNGGAPEGFDLNFSSNWPLRGVKNTLWEGGTRVAAAIWSPFIETRVSQDLMHAQDWLPTLYEATGGNTNDLKGIDGVSLWRTFTEGEPSPRTSFLYNIDDIYNHSAVREGPWKLIQGNTSTVDLGGGIRDFWYGPSGRSGGFPFTVASLIPQIASSMTATALESIGMDMNFSHMRRMQKNAEISCIQPISRIQIPCNAYEAPCLFNVEDDPCEFFNEADQNPQIVGRLLLLIAEHNGTALPPLQRIAHQEAWPRFHGNTWTTWEDDGKQCF
ncbi:unnamed protein product [Orchesella dallaii]|uniref:Sulfatase N-terminal domain-containing protein n=1 Tax=Orchesella dallaii TaxID=48710 RepID=A0ABP1S5F7_9HEXA